MEVERRLWTPPGLSRHLHFLRRGDTISDPNTCKRCWMVWNILVHYSYRMCGPVTYQPGGRIKRS